MSELARSLCVAVSATLLAGAGVAEAAGAGWTAAQRAAVARSGRVDPALVAALDASDDAAAFVLLQPTGSPGGSSRAAAADAVLAGLAPGDFRIARRYRHVSALAGRITRAGLLRLLERDEVRRVGVDLRVETLLAESVALVGLDSLHLEGHTASGQVVAVIDTGIDADHEDLIGSVVAEHCFCQGANGTDPGGCCPDGSDEQDGPGAAVDAVGHGTRVAGIVTSNGTSAPVGGAPDASLVVVRVFPANGIGEYSDVLAALEWIVDQRPDVTVVNLSLGAGFYPGDCDDQEAELVATAELVAALRARRVPTVAGSGNTRSGAGMFAPACIADVLSVSAVWDADLGSQTWFNCTDAVTYPDLVTCFGNSGATTDLFAPGALMTSSRESGGAITRAGTSYATPLVSACAAVLLEAIPLLTPGQLETLLEASPTQVTDPKNGLTYPRLDCAHALASAGSVVPAVPAAGIAALALLALAAARRHLTRAVRSR